jgi:hypothetical protein
MAPPGPAVAAAGGAALALVALALLGLWDPAAAARRALVAGAVLARGGAGGAASAASRAEPREGPPPPPTARFRLPRRIVLLRHGESLGNVKESVYRVIPDWQIPLTERGKLQAREASRRIVELLGAGQAVIYYSPYTRTVETLDQILEAIPPEQVCIVQEEPRIREQDFGNYQDNTMQDIKKERARFGRFFYRFPEGESGADGTSFSHSFSFFRGAGS